MPRLKSKTRTTKPTIATKELKDIKPVNQRGEDDYYRCCTCGKKYKRQQGNFCRSQSQLYKGNNCYLPICLTCLENLFGQYTEILGSEEKAIERLCLHWDMYYTESIVEASKKPDVTKNRLRNYIKNINTLSQNLNKTYDTYLRELQEKVIESVEQIEEMKEEGQTSITKAMFERWGQVAAEDMTALDEHYKMLKKHNPNCDNNQEIFIKDLCFIKILQMKSFKENNSADFDKYTKLYRDTFKQAGLKTVQEDDGSGDNTLGVNAAIISQYTPEEFYKDKKLFDDFDNIRDYFERHVLRPLRNLEFGDTARDAEFNIGDSDETE